MTIVAGVDFGTLSVRVTLVDSRKGPVGTASASYPLHRRREDPNFATQSHADQMAALAAAIRDVLASTGVEGSAVAAIALDTTGSSVIPVGEGLGRPAGRVLSVVRSSRLCRGRGDHRHSARAGFRRYRMVRRHLFPRMGIRQAAALAAPQPGEALQLCDRS